MKSSKNIQSLKNYRGAGLANKGARGALPPTNLEISYNNVIYQVITKAPGYNMRGAEVTVCESGGRIYFGSTRQNIGIDNWGHYISIEAIALILESYGHDNSGS